MCRLHREWWQRTSFYDLNSLRWERGESRSVLLLLATGLARAASPRSRGRQGRAGQPCPAPGRHRPRAWPAARSLWSAAGFFWGHGPRLLYTRRPSGSFLPPGLALAILAAWQNVLLIKFYSLMQAQIKKTTQTKQKHPQWSQSVSYPAFLQSSGCCPPCGFPEIPVQGQWSLSTSLSYK